MKDALVDRLYCLAPLVPAALLMPLGGLDPLALPLIVGLCLGFALRPIASLDLPLLAAAQIVLLTPSLPWQLAAAVALLGLGLYGARRVAIVPVGLGAGAVVAAGLLDPDGPATVLRQLRLLALAGGGGVVALLGLWILARPADGSGRRLMARRAAALAAVVGWWSLCRGAAGAWPDGWRLASPYLVWAAPALAAIALLGARRGRVLVTAAPAAAALLGALSGTALGIDAAAWALGGAALVAGLAGDEGRLGRWTTAATAGLPIGLSFVAGGIALWAAGTAVHPAPLTAAALLTGGLMLVGGGLALRNSALGDVAIDRRVAIGLGVAALLFVSPIRPTGRAADEAATVIDGHRLPIDDMSGWRRLSRLETRPPDAAPDAGAP